MFILTKSKPYVITRFNSGSYIDGRWTKDTTPNEFEILANIQPVKKFTIQQMPESDRTLKWCKVYTKSILRTKREGIDGYDGDRFTYRGDIYEVRDVEINDAGILDHTKALASRLSLSPQAGIIT
jgi:ribosomal protein S4E